MGNRATSVGQQPTETAKQPVGGKRSKAMEGRCACGAVRYRLRDGPLIVHACHCLDCQRLTGSAFVINLWIERELVELRGAAPQSFRLAGGSGRAHEVFFCAACGTTMWSRYSGAGDCLFVRAGTLERPARVEPDVHIFTRSKLPWLELPRGARAFRSYYRLASVWSAASRARLERSRRRAVAKREEARMHA
jgi:hypothetical protein